MTDEQPVPHHQIPYRFLGFGGLGVLGVILYLWFVKFDANITGFFRIGELFAKSPYLDLGAARLALGEIGADGQQFLTIAFDPFLQNPGTIEALDLPYYRYGRILYPLLGHILGLGQPALIPYAMVALNGIAILAIAWILRSWRIERPTILPSLIFCIPGIWIALAFSTSELVASAFWIGALFYYDRHCDRLAALAIGLAALTKETMLLMAIALVLTSLWEQRWRTAGLLSLSTAVPIAWLVWVRSRPQLASPRSAFQANFSWPFHGIAQKWSNLVADGFQGKDLYEIYLTGLMLVTVVFLFIYILSNLPTSRLFLLPAVLYTTLLVSVSLAVVRYYLDYKSSLSGLLFAGFGGTSLGDRTSARSTLWSLRSSGIGESCLSSDRVLGALGLAASAD